MLPYLALPRMGFAMPFLLPETRWALTPPFHPYHRLSFAVAACATTSQEMTLPPCGVKVELRRYLSVALSVTSQCPAINRHPALWGPDFPPDAAFALASSGCLANFPQVLYALDETGAYRRNTRLAHFPALRRVCPKVARVANPVEKNSRRDAPRW